MLKKSRLFTPGPTPLQPAVQEALARPILHHRTDEFRAVFKECTAGLKQFLKTDDEYFDYSPCDPPPTGRWCISALDLPAEVLRLVYSGNAQTLIPGLRH